MLAPFLRTKMVNRSTRTNCRDKDGEAPGFYKFCLTNFLLTERNLLNILIRAPLSIVNT